MWMSCYVVICIFVCLCKKCVIKLIEFLNCKRIVSKNFSMNG